MKGAGLLLIVGGWVVAVGGILASEDTAVRMGVALVGFATSLAGIGLLNGGHLENALWKARGH